MKRFEKIKELIISLEEDFIKFYENGNQAAGTRIRRGMQELKNLAQEIRIEVQDVKNAGPDMKRGGERDENKHKGGGLPGAQEESGGMDNW